MLRVGGGGRTGHVYFALGQTAWDYVIHGAILLLYDWVFLLHLGNAWKGIARGLLVIAHVSARAWLLLEDHLLVVGWRLRFAHCAAPTVISFAFLTATGVLLLVLLVENVVHIIATAGHWIELTDLAKIALAFHAFTARRYTHHLLTAKHATHDILEEDWAIRSIFVIFSVFRPSNAEITHIFIEVEQARIKTFLRLADDYFFDLGNRCIIIWFFSLVHFQIFIINSNYRF